jgi:hypothetical protein
MVNIAFDGHEPAVATRATAITGRECRMPVLGAFAALS